MLDFTLIDLISMGISIIIVMAVMYVISWFVPKPTKQKPMWGLDEDYIDGYSIVIVAFRFGEGFDLSTLMRIIVQSQETKEKSVHWAAGASQAINDIATGFSGPVKEYSRDRSTS